MCTSFAVWGVDCGGFEVEFGFSVDWRGRLFGIEGIGTRFLRCLWTLDVRSRMIEVLCRVWVRSLRSLGTSFDLLGCEPGIGIVFPLLRSRFCRMGFC